MKKSVIVVCLIALFLCMYCMAERMYLGSFSKEANGYLLQLERSEQTVESKNTFFEFEGFLRRKKGILEQVAPRAEIEQMFISLGHLEAYLQQGNTEEVKVSAAEIKKIIEDICQAPII
ncbi:MAG: hypothetical protein IJN42_07145 [Clostridia bacterium]|nr:hypothetical protein [Clostridia bacterium]